MNFSSLLLAKRQLNDTLATFTFVKPPTFMFKPGQFILISSDKEFSNPHPFSISSAPGDSFLEIAVRKIAEFTTNMHNALLGTNFWFKGPFGMFTLEQSNEPAILIAGGVGITPFLSMLRDALFTDSKKELTLLYSIRTTNDILEKESLNNIVKISKNINIKYVLSQEQTSDPAYMFGRIDADFLRQNIPDVANKKFYICGPPPMVAALKEALISLTVNEDNIHVDNWDFAKKIVELNSNTTT